MTRSNAKSDLIDIACEIRQRRATSIAVADGTMEGSREKWFWLPLSLIEINEDDGTVAMPEWLAIERGLV